MEKIRKIDDYIIFQIQKYFPWIARIALFIVFFWFGYLKLIDISPAAGLVQDLLENTLPFISFATFIKLFAVYEMIIGISFLIPGFERVAIALLIPHMITTAGPLFLLPSISWQEFLVPTLEGQYIIKNLVIIACAMGLASDYFQRTRFAKIKE